MFKIILYISHSIAKNVDIFLQYNIKGGSTQQSFIWLVKVNNNKAIHAPYWFYTDETKCKVERFRSVVLR